MWDFPLAEQNAEQGGLSFFANACRVVKACVVEKKQWVPGQKPTHRGQERVVAQLSTPEAKGLG